MDLITSSGFQRLPIEILRHICSYLKYGEIVVLSIFLGRDLWRFFLHQKAHYQPSFARGFLKELTGTGKGARDLIRELQGVITSSKQAFLIYERRLADALERKIFLNKLLKKHQIVIRRISSRKNDCEDSQITFNGHQGDEVLLGWLRTFRTNLIYLENKEDEENYEKMLSIKEKKRRRRAIMHSHFCHQKRVSPEEAGYSWSDGFNAFIKINNGKLYIFHVY